ncbi:MAG: hypothetical protein ACLFOY_05385 [Desulfatibacillaceae bacterium]
MVRQLTGRVRRKTAKYAPGLRKPDIGIAVLILVALVGAASWMDVFRVATRIAPAGVRHVHGNLYRYDISPLWAPFLEVPGGRPVVGAMLGGDPVGKYARFALKRNGEPVRSRADNLLEISEQGGGTWMVADRTLLFSSTHGGKPGKDGVLYEVSHPVRVSRALVALPLAVGLALLWFRFAPSRTSRGPARPMGRRARALAWLCAVGTALLCANIAGYFVPLRGQGLNYEQHAFFYPVDITIGPDAALGLLVKTEEETTRQYCERATWTLQSAMAYYWSAEGEHRYGMRVPAWENPVLYLLSMLDPDVFTWEYADHRAALSRGVGLCGQQATALAGFLAENGIPVAVAWMEGHVVCQAEVEPGRRIVLDPALGLVLPYDLETLRERPEWLLQRYTLAWKRLFRPELHKYADLCAAVTAGAFAGEHMVSSPLVASKPWAATPRVRAERMLYFLKWAVPLVLMLPLALVFAARFGRLYARGIAVIALLVLAAGWVAWMEFPHLVPMNRTEPMRQYRPDSRPPAPNQTGTFLDDFTTMHPRWAAYENEGAGYHRLLVKKDSGVVEIGITAAATSEAESDCSLEEKTASHAWGRLETRLKTSDDNSSPAAGTMGWGLWRKTDEQGVDAVWFLACSPESSGELQGLRAMVVRDGGVVFSRRLELDPTEWREYAIETSPRGARFFVDGAPVAEAPAGSVPETRFKAVIWMDNKAVNTTETGFEISHLNVPRDRWIRIDNVAWTDGTALE